MWDSIRLSAVGDFTLRKIAVLIVAALLSVLFVATWNSTTSFADTAKWEGEDIVLGGKTYKKDSATLPDVGPSNDVYVNVPPTGDIATAIVVPSGKDKAEDIPDAALHTYRYDRQTATYSIPDPPVQTSAVTIAASPDGGTTGENDKPKTSCDISSGIGWIVCGTSRFMADTMDRVYGWISDFLTVKPLSDDADSGLYMAWDIVRGIANACFIIAFLIIIYSQITSVGISNYEIKKMIPRLIIAAILVNASFYICTIAVDISNILGDSVQKSFEQIRESLPAPMPEIGWQKLTAFILSGGTIGGIAAIAGFTGAAVGGSISALAALLFPVLVMGILSVLVALMILAARQALIIVLVVLAPLAFVAYLLPNTEGLFEKWRKLFMTMLLVFPLFSLLFGGSQLAASLIIQSTDSLSVVVLAMFVQVAPLALTPFLVKFSGSLLGRLAGMVNNPQKGLVDRTRNWAKDRADTQAKRRIAKGEHQSRFSAGGYAYKRSMDRKNREGRKKLYESRIDAAWANDSRSQHMLSQTKMADLKKGAGDATGERMYEEAKASDTPTGRALQSYATTQRVEQLRTKQRQTTDDARWEEALTGNINPTDNPDNYYAGASAAAHHALREQHIAENNSAVAQAISKSEFATELSQDVALQIRAGGIGGQKGAIKVKSKAMSEVIKTGIEDVEAIKNASDIKPGDIDAMEVEFRRAVRDGDIASLRAHTDMLGSSKDAGIQRLREVLRDTEVDIRANADMIETFRHHVNSNAEINQSAEDIGVWSRDNFDGWRSLNEIGRTHKTWKNMNVNTFSGMKASTQRLALESVRDDGSWAITEKMAYEIMASPSAWSNIKDEVKPLIEDRAAGYIPVRGR